MQARMGIEVSLEAARRANYQAILTELETYHETKRRFLEELEELVALCYPRRAQPVEEGDPVWIRGEGGYSDPTPERAVVMSMMRHYTGSGLVMMETARRLRAIEAVMEALRSDPEPKKYELAQLQFLNEPNRRVYGDAALAQKLSVSERTVRRWRRSIVRAVAQRLGVMV